MDKTYYEIYALAHNNALELLQEAKLLFSNRAFARAYTLAYISLEEVSKSQFAADVYTNFSTEDQFKKFYRSHEQKLQGVQWVHNDANTWPYNTRWVGPNEDDVETIKPGKPTFDKRQESMYVDVNFSTKTVTAPRNSISENEARDMINLVEVAIQHIDDVEQDQGRIGTKGFMK
jgi:AbiV family abortive infection protein